MLIMLLSSQSGHSHLPAGAAVRPRHSKWNHSIGQATLSHAIISPYSPSWHQQYTSSLSLDFAALFDFALEVRIPLEHRLFAWAFLTPSARRSLMLSRCCNQNETSCSGRSVCFANSVISRLEMVVLLFWDFSNASLMIAEGGVSMQSFMPSWRMCSTHSLGGKKCHSNQKYTCHIPLPRVEQDLE